MKKLLTALLAGLAFSSCVPSTPQARIAQNPQVFAALPKKDQSLVERGQVARGMSPDAVMLAWGYPSRRFEGSKDSKRTERWDYAGSRPVYTSTFYGGYGYGYGRWGYGGGMSTTHVNYDKYTEGTLFITLVDKASEKIAWQGTGKKTIDEKETSVNKEDYLQDGQSIGMANGNNITIHMANGKMTVNEGINIIASIPTSNGLIYVTDKVLLPPAK